MTFILERYEPHTDAHNSRVASPPVAPAPPPMPPSQPSQFNTIPTPPPMQLEQPVTSLRDQLKMSRLALFHQQVTICQLIF